MPSAPHAFGIDGTTASGGRVYFDNGCPLDCDFGETAYSSGRLVPFDHTVLMLYMYYHFQVMNA